MWQTDKMRDRMHDLSPNMQNSFLHLVDEMYDQESTSMIRFIEESRKQLRMIGYEFNSEQEALRQTGDHLSATSRLSDTSSKLSSGSAHHPHPDSAGHRSPCGSSLDSVSFESEQSSAKNSRGRSKASLGISLRPSSRQVSPMPSPGYHQQTTVTPQTPRPREDSQFLPTDSPSPIQQFVVTGPRVSSGTSQRSVMDEAVYDSSKEYEEEKEKIMKSMSGVHQTLEKERTRQNMKAQERMERKKEKTLIMATKMVREASALEEMKVRDQRRQEDMVKQRIEMKKRQREKSDLVARSLTHRPASEAAMEHRNYGFLTERPGTASTCTATDTDPIDFDIKNPLKSKKTNKKERENIPEAWGVGDDKDDVGEEVGNKKKSKKKKKSKDKDKEESIEMEEGINSDQFEVGQHKKKTKKKDKEESFEPDDGIHSDPFEVGQHKKGTKKKGKDKDPEDDQSEDLDLKDEDDNKTKKKKKRNRDKDIRETPSLDVL